MAWFNCAKAVSPNKNPLLKAKTEADFRTCVSEFLNGRDDTTLPKHGWPWPWENSQITDYAYAFDKGKVYASNFGHDWFIATKKEPEYERESTKVPFPNMKTNRMAPIGSNRSGLMIFTSTKS